MVRSHHLIRSGLKQTTEQRHNDIFERIMKIEMREIKNFKTTTNKNILLFENLAEKKHEPRT